MWGTVKSRYFDPNATGNRHNHGCHHPENNIENKPDKFCKNKWSIKQYLALQAPTDDEWNQDQELLQKLDWFASPLYEHYLDSSEKKQPLLKFILKKYSKMYTLQELEYNIKQMTIQADTEAENPGKDRKVYQTQFKKAMHTIDILLMLLNLEFFYERLEKRYEGQKPTAEHAVALMIRCQKFYNAVEHVGLIFKLITRKDTLTPADDDEDKIEYDKTLFDKDITTANWVIWNATFVSLA